MKSTPRISTQAMRRENGQPHSPAELDTELAGIVAGAKLSSSDKVDTARTLQWWANQLFWNTGEIHNPKRFGVN